MRKLIFTPLVIGVLFILLVQPAFAGNAIKPKRVAVLPFTCTQNDYSAGSISSIGSMATDCLTSDLVKMRSCQVVERPQLDKVLHEQQLNATGVVSPNTAVKLGGILGLDYLIIGNVSVDTLVKRGYQDSKGNYVKPSYTTKVAVIVKLVDAKNGEIVWSDQRDNQSYAEERSNINVGGTVEEAVYDMARRIYESYLPLQGYLIKKDGNRFTLDLGADDNVKEGDIFFVSGVVEAYRHPITGELIKDVKNKGRLKVLEVSSRLCVAEFMEDDKNSADSITVGDKVAKQIRKKPKGFLGLGWSGKHEF